MSISHTNYLLSLPLISRITHFRFAKHRCRRDSRAFLICSVLCFQMNLLQLVFFLWSVVKRVMGLRANATHCPSTRVALWEKLSKVSRLKKLTLTYDVRLFAAFGLSGFCPAALALKPPAKHKAPLTCRLFSVRPEGVFYACQSPRAASW